MSVRALFIVLALAAGAGRAIAQTPAAAPAAQGTPEAKPAEMPPTPAPDYSYAHESRRDPFLNLIDRGTDAGRGKSATSRPDGVKGVLVNEVVVRGIVKSGGGWVAMVGAPNGKTYTVRAGDRLMDGAVRSISPQALILMQEVNDPLSLEKQREVRKYLRGGEEVQ